jgi:hypothetical protein
VQHPAHTLPSVAGMSGKFHVLNVQHPAHR